MTDEFDAEDMPFTGEAESYVGCLPTDNVLARIGGHYAAVCGSTALGTIGVIVEVIRHRREKDE